MTFIWVHFLGSIHLGAFTKGEFTWLYSPRHAQAQTSPDKSRQFLEPETSTMAQYFIFPYIPNQYEKTACVNTVNAATSYVDTGIVAIVLDDDG